MTLPMVLGCGPDTLVMNVLPTDNTFEVKRRRLDDDLQEELDRLKQQAQDAEEPIPTRWVFEGGNLFMKEKGGSHFKWILDHPYLSVAIGRGVKVLMLGQVRLSSEFLWREGDLGNALYKVHAFLTTLFGEYFTLQVSAFDLAVDVVWDIGARPDLKESFITRAQLDDERPLTALDDGWLDGPESIHRRWRRVTGLPFGARNAAVSALLYDKTHEIEYVKQDKQWFRDLWLSRKDERGQPLWDGKAAVWRVELRFKRQALAEGNLESVYDLLEMLPGLWAYGVGHVTGGEDGLPDGWLRYVTPTADTNRSRWPVHPDWQVIQGAFVAAVAQEATTLPPEPAPLLPVLGGEFLTEEGRTSLPFEPEPFDLKPFIRECKRRVQMERAIAAIAGYASTIEAWRVPLEGDAMAESVERDLSETFHFVYRYVDAYLQEKDREFSALVHKKRVLYRLEAVAA